MKILGQFYHANSSASTPAVFLRVGSRIEIEVAGSTLNFNLSEIRISDRIGNISRKIYLPEGRLFETQDNDSIDKILSDFNKTDWIYFLEKNYKAAGTLGIVLVLLMLFSYFVGLPWVSKKGAPHVPRKVAELITEQTEIFLTKTKMITPSQLSEEENINLQKIFQKASDVTQVANLKFKIYSSPQIGPNAFALPDGTIFMTDELIELSNFDHDELIGVLLHEISHVKNHHGMQQLIQSSALTMVLVILTGGGDWTNLPFVVLMNSYSRDHESEADEYAIKYMRELELPPGALASILDKMQEFQKTKKSEFELLSTHPDTDKRIDYLKSK